MDLTKLLTSQATPKGTDDLVRSGGKVALTEGESSSPLEFLQVLSQLQGADSESASVMSVESSVEPALQQLIEGLNPQEVEGILNHPHASTEIKQLLSKTQKLMANKDLSVQQMNASPSAHAGNVDLQQILNSNFENISEVPQKPLGANRSPAIDFSPTEVDQQLMSFEDFVAQRNLVNKKNPHSGVYGTQVKNQLIQKNKNTDGIHELSNPTQKIDSSMNIPQMMNADKLNSNLNVELHGSQITTKDLFTGEVKSQPKIFQLSDMKNLSTDQVIDKIKDYIIQAKTASEPTVNLKVQHQDLGLLDITVNKMPQEAIQIGIQTQSAESKLFLSAHQKDLIQVLNQNGIQVSDMKIENTNQSLAKSFDQSDSQSSSQQSFSGQKNFGSENNQRQHDSQRRQELWKMMEEREVA